MSGLKDRFLFASAPDSWGVLDYPGPSWKQSYEKILDEMVSAGYTGTELGPYMDSSPLMQRFCNLSWTKGD